MKPRALLLVAGAVFAVSFFLPAYADSTGLECFNFCLGLIRKFPTESPLKWLYYSAFFPTNLAFITLFTLGFSRPSFHKTRFIVSAAAFFHVLSWLLVNVRREDIGMLKIGYFLWLASFTLLVAAQISAARKSAAT